jgi:hypothetical protein
MELVRVKLTAGDLVLYDQRKGGMSYQSAFRIRGFTWIGTTDQRGSTLKLLGRGTLSLVD